MLCAFLTVYYNLLQFCLLTAPTPGRKQATLRAAFVFSLPRAFTNCANIPNSAKEIQMSKVQAIPEGYHTITPALVCKNCAKAIDFYKQTFQAKELSRMPMPDNKIGHAELQIGDSRLMLSDEFPGMAAAPNGGTASYSLFVYTENVDALFDRAVKAGSTVEMPLQNQFWGDRYGKVRDPFGHVWGLAQHVEDVAPEDMDRRMKAAMEQMSKTAGKS